VRVFFDHVLRDTEDKLNYAGVELAAHSSAIQIDIVIRASAAALKWNWYPDLNGSPRPAAESEKITARILAIAPRGVGYGNGPGQDSRTKLAPRALSLSFRSQAGAQRQRRRNPGSGIPCACSLRSHLRGNDRVEAAVERSF